MVESDPFPAPRWGEIYVDAELPGAALSLPPGLFPATLRVAASS